MKMNRIKCVNDLYRIPVYFKNRRYHTVFPIEQEIQQQEKKEEQPPSNCESCKTEETGITDSTNGKKINLKFKMPSSFVTYAERAEYAHMKTTRTSCSNNPEDPELYTALRRSKKKEKAKVNKLLLFIMTEEDFTDKLIKQDQYVKINAKVIHEQISEDSSKDSNINAETCNKDTETDV